MVCAGGLGWAAAAEAGEALESLFPHLAEPWEASSVGSVAVAGLLQPGVCVVVKTNMHLCCFLLTLHCCKWMDQWDHNGEVWAPARHSTGQHLFP